MVIFDDDPGKFGMKVGPYVVQDVGNVPRYIEENQVDICVLAVPGEYAQASAESMYQAGIRAFWNFAPLDLKLPKDATVVNVHLEEGLQILSFRMLQKQGLDASR